MELKYYYLCLCNNNCLINVGPVLTVECTKREMSQNPHLNGVEGKSPVARFLVIFEAYSTRTMLFILMNTHCL